MILTLDNKAFDLNNLPEEVDENMRFSVLDNSDYHNPDFFFMPLIFLESFNSPAMVLRIGDDEVTMPIDWSIAVGDSSSSCDLEILPLTSLNDRGFEALCFNFYNDVKWYFPKMKTGQLLSVPLNKQHKPLCSFFVKEINRQSEMIDLSKLL